jgi:hypothetical protein
MFDPLLGTELYHFRVFSFPYFDVFSAACTLGSKYTAPLLGPMSGLQYISIAPECMVLFSPESIERFIEDQTFSPSCKLAPPPLSSLFQSFCVSPVELTDREGRSGGE